MLRTRTAENGAGVLLGRTLDSAMEPSPTGSSAGRHALPAFCGMPVKVNFTKNCWYSVGYAVGYAGIARGSIGVG